MIRRTPWFLVLAAVAFAGNWPHLGLDAARLRSSAKMIGFTLTTAWTKPVASRIIASPVTADGFIVFGTRDGQIAAVREREGVNR